MLCQATFIAHVIDAVPGIHSMAKQSIPTPATTTNNNNKTLCSRLLNAIVSFGLCIPAKLQGPMAVTTPSTTTSNKSTAEKGLAISCQNLLKTMKSRSWNDEFDTFFNS